MVDSLRIFDKNGGKRNMPAVLCSEVASRKNAEEAIMHLLRRHPGRGMAIADVLRKTRYAASVDEGTARRAVLRLAANRRAVLDSMLKISSAE
jgi:hypothetical protein